jgi:ankyrin repeat protein
VKKFISLGSDPRIKSLSLQNVIHLTAESGLDNLLVYFAKELGTPIDDKDKNEKTPLALACVKGHFSTACFLIAWNANVNSVDLQGNSVLHLAALSQCYKLVRILVIKGSCKSAVNNEGKNALDTAKENHLGDIIEVLVFDR